ncbi:MAG: DNA polymerase III subunit delta' [Rhodospirillales bacterium]|jgi:DNA polymerase-3 subunit delta'|nr:DNA polymerase III subunit delta' [Rhodospirillaceae bacterium]MDP6430266.1 DNA polymerase III subunit delta' [Rhodospirillales bacterium]MDP6643927.1 DNA polymerase III subunit delta' [Rhodospirillales bacterium]
MSPDSIDPGADDWPPEPRKNPDLTGQERAERAFLDAYLSRRLPHAWLITGPRGVGKATLAHRIARFLLVHGRLGSSGPGGDEGPGLFGDDLPGTDPESLATDLQHLVCRRVTAGGHTDFMLIKREINEKTGRLHRDISVDSVRAIGHFLSLTPGEGGWRVVVIDAADEMSASAANAVLKVLEEPPARSVLLLVSHNPGRLLETIRSRCRHLPLPPLGPDAMAGLLGRHAPDIGSDERDVLLHLAGGSIGRALRLAGEGGVDLYAQMRALLATLPHLDIGALHKLGDLVARDRGGDRFRTIAELIDWWLVGQSRDKSRDSSGGDGGGGGGLEGWFGVWEKTNRLFREAEGLNLDRKQVVLEVFLSIEDAARG